MMKKTTNMTFNHVQYYLNSSTKPHLRSIDCCTKIFFQLNPSGKIKATPTNILFIILKASLNIYWKHLFTFWIQTDIKSDGNCRNSI